MPESIDLGTDLSSVVPVGDKNIARVDDHPGEKQSVRIAAVIGHSDRAEMLGRCISHHLDAGCDAIFVSLNRDDRESVSVVDEFSRSAEVKGAPVREFARDEFDFLTDAVRQADDLFQPDRILVIDSDEFCVAQSGGLKRVSGLGSVDLLTVPRYNAALTLGDGTELQSPAASSSTRVIPQLDERQSQHFATMRPELKWLASRIGPKMIVSPAAVGSVWRGGHGINSARPATIQARSADLAIVHFPFTTIERFKYKLDGIRMRIGSFKSGEAGHWKTWLRAAEEGRLEELFAAQFFTPTEAAILESQGLIESVRSMFGRQAWAPELAASTNCEVEPTYISERVRSS